MNLAAALADKTRRKRSLEADLRQVNADIKGLNQQVLEAIENGELPHSFKTPDGASIYTRTLVRASAKDKDHGRLAAVLAELGLVEYLPKTVNSNSISAFVREHWNDVKGCVEDMDPRLVDALNIVDGTEVVVNL